MSRRVKIARKQKAYLFSCLMYPYPVKRLERDTRKQKRAKRLNAKRIERERIFANKIFDAWMEDGTVARAIETSLLCQIEEICSKDKLGATNPMKIGQIQSCQV